MKVVFAGHSFIRRLREYCSDYPFEFPLHPVLEQRFCCRGGWKIRNLKDALATLSDHTISSAVIYLEIGTNDLCDANCEPKQLAVDVGHLCCDLLSRGAAFVIVAEPLPRFGRALAQLEEKGVNFSRAVTVLVHELRLLLASMPKIKVWRHAKVVPSYSLMLTPEVPSRYLADGVHLGRCRSPCASCACGMKRYWRSVRGALLHAMRNC
jgi:hypothetical protein